MIFRKSAKKNSPTPILESVEHITGKDEFINKAGLFREDLGAASSFQEMLNLWRTTQIPYKIDLPDPYSDEYREEVTSIYAGLTGEDYDVANEWTSTKQSAEDFERGYPWVSGDFGVIADEIAKPIQVLRALQHRRGQEIRAIEFGSGWGNLSVPMAKAGINVTLVDIDQGFLDRASRIAAREGITMATVCGDFLGVAQSMSERFDVVIFQSAFHQLNKHQYG